MMLYRALLDISLPTIVVAVLGMPETIIGFLEYLLFLNMNKTQSNAKEKKYQKSIRLINTLDAKDKIDNIIKCLFEEFEDWIFCGFYIEKDNYLEISNYLSDKIPCSPIQMNGVCGQSLLKNKTLIVADVNKFTNHIVCDENSKSEIAIPFIKNNKRYVLDIDSKNLDDFNQVDEKYLKKILEKI
jgi:putative methionine-R-sulfoxide reductase with GAF domain